MVIVPSEATSTISLGGTEERSDDTSDSDLTNKSPNRILKSQFDKTGKW